MAQENNHRAEPLRPQNLTISKGLRADEAKGKSKERRLCVESASLERRKRMWRPGHQRSRADHMSLQRPRSTCTFPCTLSTDLGANLVIMVKEFVDSMQLEIRLKKHWESPSAFTGASWYRKTPRRRMHAIVIVRDSRKLGLWAMTADAKGPIPAAVGWLSSKIE